MTRWRFATSAVVSALFALAPFGCVTAYDPASASRLGTDQGTPARVVAPPRPGEVAPPPIPGVTITEARPEPGATPPGPVLPETAVGRQTTWVLGALNGQIEKKFEKRFDPEFLARLPGGGDEVRRTVQQWRRDQFASGPSRVDRVLHTDDRTIEALLYAPAADRYAMLNVEVDPLGRIRGLSLAPAAMPDANTTWAGLDAQLAALPGQAALAALALDPAGAPRDIHQFGADRVLAISSIARLYVAGAVAEEIAAGRLKPDEMITIQDSLKSLPTGRLQLLPEGTEVRLADALESMIAPGDNTAADHLMFRIGRDRVEAFAKGVGAAGARAGPNAPFLATMELHKLKLADRGLAERYIAAGEPERRSMLAPGGLVEQATIGPAALGAWREPRFVREIEWFATARQCAALLAELERTGSRKGLELLGRALKQNPLNPFEGGPWRIAGFASGEEPGVLSMAWVLERTDGRRYALALVWNDPDRALDGARLGELAGVAAGLLAKME